MENLLVMLNGLKQHLKKTIKLIENIEKNVITNNPSTPNRSSSSISGSLAESDEDGGPENVYSSESDWKSSDDAESAEDAEKPIPANTARPYERSLDRDIPAKKARPYERSLDRDIPAKKARQPYERSLDRDIPANTARYERSLDRDIRMQSENEDTDARVSVLAGEKFSRNDTMVREVLREMRMKPSYGDEQPRALEKKSYKSKEDEDYAEL